jgi:hypothetical protein
MCQTKVVEKIGTHFMVNSLFPKIVPFMRYVGKYDTLRQDTDGNIIGGMRFACWTNKSADTHSEYLIFIAFPRQKWFVETAPILRFTYTSYLVMSS